MESVAVDRDRAGHQDEDRCVRVWIDDQNPIFRLGLAACLRRAGFVLAGEGAGLTPRPAVDRTDVLIFELDGASLAAAAGLSRHANLRLVAVADDARDPRLFDAIAAGVAGILIRSEVTPAAVADCVRAAAAGHGTVPAAVVARMATSGGPGARPGGIADLSDRELDVLRLLAEGRTTRAVADRLCYSEKTIKNIVHDVLVRTGCRNRAEAVAMAARQGII